MRSEYLHGVWGWFEVIAGKSVTVNRENFSRLRSFLYVQVPILG